MESIDAAFQSRIDLMLPFDPLTLEARREVWRSFVEVNGGSDKFDVDDATHLAELAALDLNGREIKNLVKTALVLNVAEGGGAGNNNNNNNKVAGGNLVKLAKMRIRAQQLLEE